MTDNYRDHTRIAMDTRVFVEVLASEDGSKGLVVQCRVVDISFGGFRVTTDNELSVGTILSVCAELPSVAEPFYLATEVIWCRPNEEAKTGWLAGFKLLNSSDTDINAWRDLLKHV